MRFFPPTTSNNLKGTGLIFYCKDCEKIVDVIPVGRKFVYKCAICKTKNVAFGTDKSIRNFFRLPEEDKTAPVVAEPAVVPAPSTPAQPVITQPEKAASTPPIAQKSDAPLNPPEQPTAPMPIPENK